MFKYIRVAPPENKNSVFEAKVERSTQKVGPLHYKLQGGSHPFDEVFLPKTSQEDVYESSVRPAVER